MKLSILIVSYNTRELTLACLQSVYEQTQSFDFEVILVDNASDDGSGDAVSVAFPQVRLVAEAENHGFARGNNLAASLAQGDYLLLLNPDTLVLDRALEKLVAFAERNPEAGIWGGRTIFEDGSLNPTSCRRHETLWSLFCRAFGLGAMFPNSEILNSESYGGWRRDTVRSVDIVTGCLFLIKKDTWQRLGGFSPEFFMYGEEADLCYRAHGAGCRPMITPEATIIHFGGASEKTRAGKVTKLFAAKAELIGRHWPAWQRPAGIALLQLWVLTRYSGYRILEEVFPNEGYADAAAAWSEVWRQRASWLEGYGWVNRESKFSG